MTQRTRWGVAASMAALLIAGCSGADKNPVTDGQSLSSQVTRRLSKYDKIQPIQVDQGPTRPIVKFDRQALLQEKAAQSSPAEPTGRVAVGREGSVTGSLGTFRIEIDEQLNANVVFPRTAQTQGDKYLLGIDQFFRPGSVRVTGIERTGDNLDVTVSFSHPFPRPADLLPPATATKRLDLHVFNVWAGLLLQGSESYFGGSVTTNTSVLSNADSYRQTGGLITLPSGVTSNVFPGKWIADQSPANTDPALDNYDPADNGWESSELQDPTGFGVFHQGDTEAITFSLDVNGSPLSLDFAVLADYQDPRATPTPKNNRLPDPIDPTKLRYILPYGAGDLQSVSTSVDGNLSGATLTTATIEIVDLDADAGVAASFPNEANLSEMPFASGIDHIDVSFPTGITASTPVEGTGSGTGLPTSPKIWEYTLSNTGSVADGDYTGMVRVVDEENNNLSSEVYTQLDPDLLPLATPLPIQVYQAVDFTVGATTGGNVNIVLAPFLGDMPPGPNWALADGVFTGGPQTPPQDAFNDDRIMGVAVDQVSGEAFVTAHGLMNDFANNIRWRNGVMLFNIDTMAMTIGGQLVSFQNVASAVGNEFTPRPNNSRPWIVGDAKIDLAASSGNSIWDPYPAPPVADTRKQGFMGFNDLETLWLDGVTGTNEFRPITWFIYSSGYFLDNVGGWITDYATPMGGVPGFYTDFYGAAVTDPDPFPAHDALTNQGFSIDTAVYRGNRPPNGTRDLSDNDLGIMTAIRGTQTGPAFDSLPTNTDAWEFWAMVDFDDPLTTFVELWGDFVQLPTINSQNSAGATFGAGAGSINPNSTTGFDFGRTGNRMYVVDSADDTLERYSDMLLEGDADTTVSWTFDMASMPGDLTDPIDVCVTRSGHVVVLDKGGAGNLDRLVVFDPDTLAVLGTREIANTTDGEITTGAIGIAADDSLVNIPGDDTAFVLIWDDPTNATGFGAFGGMYWYTIEDA